MALLAEELVEEWLNRQGYFTIRGVRSGVHEIDLLAVRLTERGIDCRQLEVQASVRPMSYVTPLPAAVRKATGRSSANARVRDEGQIRQGIAEFIAKKFDRPEKQRIRSQLGPGPWTRELVLHKVKYEHEVALIREAGILVHRLGEIVAQLEYGGLLLEGAGGAHLTDLVMLKTDC